MIWNRLPHVHFKRGAAARAGGAVLSLYPFKPENGPAVRAFAVNVRLSVLYSLFLKPEPAFYAFLQLQIFLETSSFIYLFKPYLFSNNFVNVLCLLHSSCIQCILSNFACKQINLTKRIKVSNKLRLKKVFVYEINSSKTLTSFKKYCLKYK